jgi:hypothetical protein
LDFVHLLVLCSNYDSEITPISILWWNGMQVPTHLRAIETDILSNWKAVFFSQFYMMDPAQKPSIPKFKTIFES